VGTKDPGHVSKTAGAPAATATAAQTQGEEEKSGPCGLPSKCEIL